MTPHFAFFCCHNTPKITSKQNSKLQFLRNTLKRKVSCSNYLLNIAVQRSLKYTTNHPPLQSRSLYFAVRSPRQSCQRLREILPPILIWHWNDCSLLAMIEMYNNEVSVELGLSNKRKNSLNYNSCFRNSRRHDKVSRRHSELAPGIFRALLWHVLRISWIHC
jgi:hypothetical protein